MNRTHSNSGYNVQIISQLLTCILSYNVDECAIFCHYSSLYAITVQPMKGKNKRGAEVAKGLVVADTHGQEI
jgi:hypothetical protein